VKKVFVQAQHLYSRLTENSTAFLSNLPHDAWIIDVEADPARDGFLFTIHSSKFLLVRSGKVIPEMEGEWSRGPRIDHSVVATNLHEPRLLTLLAWLPGGIEADPVVFPK